MISGSTLHFPFSRSSFCVQRDRIERKDRDKVRLVLNLNSPCTHSFYLFQCVLEGIVRGQLHLHLVPERTFVLFVLYRPSLCSFRSTQRSFSRSIRIQSEFSRLWRSFTKPDNQVLWALEALLISFISRCSCRRWPQRNAALYSAHIETHTLCSVADSSMMEPLYRLGSPSQGFFFRLIES